MYRKTLLAAFVSMIAVSPISAQENESNPTEGDKAKSIDPNPGKSLLDASQTKSDDDSGEKIQSVIEQSPQPQPQEPTQEQQPDPDVTPRFGTVLYESAGNVYISSVYSNSPAQKIGLQTGDRLASINGQPLSESYDVYLLLREMAPGDSISVVFQRGEQEIKREIALVSHTELMRVSSANYRGDSRIAGTTGESRRVLRPTYSENASAAEIEERIKLLEQELKELRVQLERARRVESQTPTEVDERETEPGNEAGSSGSDDDKRRSGQDDDSQGGEKEDQLSDPTDDGV